MTVDTTAVLLLLLSPCACVCVCVRARFWRRCITAQFHDTLPLDQSKDALPRFRRYVNHTHMHMLLVVRCAQL